MKVKKFTAATMKDALAQIRLDMGEDALIISTREMTAPLGKKFIEVTAAAEERPKEPSPEPPKEVKAPRKPSPGPAVAQPAQSQNLEDQIIRNRVLLSESIKPLKEELFQLRTLMSELRRSGGEKSSADLARIKEEMHGLKRLISNVSKGSDYDNLVNYSQPLKDIYHSLIANEVEEPISYKLIEMLDSQLGDEEKLNVQRVNDKLRRIIETIVVPARPVILNKKGPVIMAFVGPTGVGKTTSIAKLAARCTLQMKKRVTLITIDTYRIAAVEQLKTYAKIMDLPIYVCYSVEEMHRTIERSSDSSLVLIDTAGHSQTDSEQVKDLRSYFADDNDIEVLLVLSATTKSKDLKDISERFGDVNPSKLVFTKLDETTTYGPLLNIALKVKLPIGYFTTGQNVPDDIETATPAKLAKLILEHN